MLSPFSEYWLNFVSRLNHDVEDIPTLGAGACSVGLEYEDTAEAALTAALTKPRIRQRNGHQLSVVTATCQHTQSVHCTGDN